MLSMKWIGLLAISLALSATVSGTVLAAPSAQQSGGQICVQAFEDKDGNGMRNEADEPLLSGIGFTLSNETGRLASYTTDGVSEPYCFGNLAAGQYTIQARSSGKKGEATTPGQWVIPLANNAQYDVAYGWQLDDGAAQTASQAGGAGQSSVSPLGRIALGLLGIAILGAAGFLAYQLFLRLRSQ